MSQHGCPERLSNRSKGFQEESTSQATMEVLVETLTGTAFEMTVSPSDTIFAIKSKIFRVEGIPISQQHLVYNLKELEDWSSLGEHAIGAGAKLRLVLGMRGGPVATRRLPPPEPWRDIERLLDADRDDGECFSREGGCKVTVVVFRDGERVNMLRVRDNRDGTYSPLERERERNFPVVEVGGTGGAEGACAVQDNAVTMAKMLELRRRMETLALARAPRHMLSQKADIQKTRSEETLSGGSVVQSGLYRDYHTPTYAHYPCAPAYTDSRCRVLPPIGSRAGSARSVVTLPALPRAWTSSSTSDLNTLAHSRILPALSRHRNREHLHLSDEGLHLAAGGGTAAGPAPEHKEKDKKKLRCGLCRKRLSIATVHVCACGTCYCAPHRYAEAHACTRARPQRDK